MSHIFISYVREDSDKVNLLSEDLQSYGIDIWLDRNSITPGVRWKRAIRDAIQNGAFFIACFSSEYNNKTKSYMNEEIITAIEELRKRSIDNIWFIPVLLDNCDVADYDIGAGETLKSIQHIELFKNWNEGIKKIVSVVKKKP